MTKHKHHNNLQGLPKKEKRIFPARTVKCAWEQLYIHVRSHEDRKLIRWDAFHILVIYDCSVAKIIYLQTVSGGNESFPALTKDTCHRPRDVFSSSLTGFVPALCPQRNGRSLFSVNSVLTPFLLPLRSNLQVLIQTAQAGLYSFQSSLGCDSWYPLWFVSILLEDTEVEQCAREF